jgi:hypothetical protein
MLARKSNQHSIVVLARQQIERREPSRRLGFARVLTLLVVRQSRNESRLRH